MAEYTKDEALAFIEAIRLTLAGRTGFKWFVERLSGLSAYVESLAAENERLNACLDRMSARDGREPCCVADPDTTPDPMPERNAR